MSDKMVTFHGVQVPEADVLKAAAEIQQRKEPMEPMEPVPWVYRWKDATDADPFVQRCALRRKNADGSWSLATEWGEWNHYDDCDFDVRDGTCDYDDCDFDVRDGTYVHLQPVEGVEYEGGDHKNHVRSCFGGEWWVATQAQMPRAWVRSSSAAALWRTGQLRPITPTPWTPTVGEWVQHKTQEWEKARQVVSVVLDRVRLGNDWWAVDCVRPATPDEITAAKRIEPVDRLIVRGKGARSVWLYLHTERCWIRLDASEYASRLFNLNLDHYDILDEYTVQGAKR